MTPTWMNFGALGSSIYVGLAASGRNLHVVYLDGTEVRYRRSEDEGLTWSADIQISGALGADELPLTQCIAAEGDNIIVLYTREKFDVSTPVKLYSVSSSDNGETWGSEVTVSDGTGADNNTFFRVSLRIENGYAHLATARTITGTFVGGPLEYRRSSDNGATWSAATNIDGIAESSRPELDIINGVLHLVWMDFRSGYFQNCGEIGYTRSTDNGDTWDTSVVLTSSSNTTLRPTLAGHGDVVVVGWQQPVNSEDIRYIRSTDGGDSFGSETVLTQSSIQEHAALAYKDGVFALCYTDNAETPATSKVRLSWDDGVTFGAAVTPSVPISVNQGAPQVVFSERLLHLIDSESDGSAIVLRSSPVLSPEPSAALLDDFNRASLGANWTTGVLTVNGLAITGSAALTHGGTGYRDGAHYNVTQFADVDMIVDLSAWSDAANNGFTLYARLANPGAVDGYALETGYDGADYVWSLLRYAGGSIFDTLAVGSNGPLAFAAGDQFAFTCRDDLIIAWRKPSGGEWTQIGAWLDGNLTSGYVGIEILNNTDTQFTNLWAAEFQAVVGTFTIINGSDEQLVNINADGIDVDAYSHKDAVQLTGDELATLLDGATFGEKNIAVIADQTGSAIVAASRMESLQLALEASS
jgi:hypothetical protein